MLLRTVALLLLCVSVGMCATLGHYQAEANDEEAPAVADGVVEAATVDAAEEGGDAKVTEKPAAEEPAAEEPAADPLIGDDLPAETPAVDDPAADEPQVDVPAADGATVEEPETDSERPAGDAPAVEAVTREAVTHDLPSEEEEKEEEGNEIRPVQTEQSLDRPLAQVESSWGLNSIRSSFQTVHGYFDSLVELVGGQDGVCQYRCRYGELPQPRPGYQPSEPDGCSSSLVGFQMDLGIPAMTQCCNKLDVCYDTCGTSKYDCDSEFRSCLHGICSDLNKSLGFVNRVQACETMADTLFNTVWTLGCRSYMSSQRAACVCEGEERDEL